MSGVFTMKRMVQFSETDMAGVLHFANYYRYMEEVEHAFWRSEGFSVMYSEGESQISWPRVATSCEYLSPARFEDEIELSLAVARVGNRSVSFEIEFRRQQERFALGKTTAVCCGMKDGRFEPISIPAHLRTVLEAHQQASAKA